MRPRPARLSIACASLCLLLALGAPASGQAPTLDSFVGAWLLVPSVADGRGAIDAAFERALSNANALMRAMARQRIDTNAMLPRRITIATEGSTLTTTMHTTAAHRFRTRQRYPAQVTTEAGTDARLTQLYREGRIEMVFDLEMGRRWTVLSLSSDDRLTLTTTIDPTRLDDNVHYTLDYRRASP